MKINRYYIFYGIILGILMAFMSWVKYKFLIVGHATEIYVFIISIFFIAIGIWAGLRLSSPVIIEKQTLVEVPVKAEEIEERPREELLATFKLSLREWEVLVCLSEGLTNSQIAEKLFISDNTVKTHLKNVYQRLDVKRRTEAIKKARTNGLLK